MSEQTIIDDGENKSAATHVLLSRVVDIWIPDASEFDKTDLMNHLIHQINYWFAECKYSQSSTVYELPERYPTERPECLHGGPVDTRIWNAMLCDGYPTLADMASRSDAELLRAPNFGRACLKRLRELTAPLTQPEADK
jgi:hypothetical protein